MNPSTWDLGKLESAIARLLLLDPIDTNQLDPLAELPDPTANHDASWPRERIEGMVAAARHRVAGSAARISRGRARAAVLLASVPDQPRATLEAGIDPTTLVTRIESAIGRIARRLDRPLPRHRRGQNRPHLVIGKDARGITFARWLEATEIEPVELRCLAWAQFEQMGELERSAGEVLADTFLRGVSARADLVPGFSTATSEVSAETVYTKEPVLLDEPAVSSAVAGEQPQPEGVSISMLQEHVASVGRLEPLPEPVTAAEAGQLVASLARVEGIAEPEVREALRDLVRDRIQVLAADEKAVAILASNANDLASL